LIHTVRGRGTFVAPDAPTVDLAEQLERLREMARRLLSRAHVIGVPLPELVKLIEEAEADLAAERSANRERPQPDHD
jgi:DNA-binding transcriptional regulator YhcF (GntR family)